MSATPPSITKSSRSPKGENFSLAYFEPTTPAIGELADRVRDTVAATPLGQFMLETDCPYLAPMPFRGKRCEPAYVKEISETVAKVKGCSLEELSQATCDVARKFFPKLTAG